MRTLKELINPAAPEAPTPDVGSLADDIRMSILTALDDRCAYCLRPEASLNDIEFYDRVEANWPGRALPDEAVDHLCWDAPGQCTSETPRGLTETKIQTIAVLRTLRKHGLVA